MQILRKTSREFNGKTFWSTWFKIDNQQFTINGDYESTPELQQELKKMVASGMLEAVQTIPAGQRTNTDGSTFYSAAFTIVQPKASDSEKALAAKLMGAGKENRINAILTLEELGVDATVARTAARDAQLKDQEAQFNAELEARRAARLAARKAVADAAVVPAQPVVAPVVAPIAEVVAGNTAVVTE